MLRLHSEGGEKDLIWQALKIIIKIKQREKQMYAQQYFKPQKEKFVYRNQHDMNIQATNFVKVKSCLAKVV